MDRRNLTIAESAGFFQVVTLVSCVLFVWPGAALATTDATSPAADGKVEPYRSELLELAFDTAAAMPLNPHIKDRSRCEHEVVEACLQLNQPRLAERLAKRITNYRRGVAFGDIAIHYARLGRNADARRALDDAIEIAEVGDMQEWRVHAIRARLAQAYILLGDAEQAKAYGSHLDVSQQGLAERAYMEVMTDDQFDQRLASLTKLLDSEVMDIRRHGMMAASALYDRVFDNAQRREMAANLVVANFKTMPALVRIDTLGGFVDAALRHNDREQAIRWVDQIDTLVTAFEWPPRFDVPLRCRLAELRFRTGQEDEALAMAESAMAVYRQKRDQIVDIWRSGAIRPLGAAYQRMGKTAEARQAYATAVEESTVNPNARPTAEDISAICVSMAVSGFEPDASLKTRIRQIREGLGPPW